jgi:hypothetical protein
VWVIYGSRHRVLLCDWFVNPKFRILRVSKIIKVWEIARIDYLFDLSIGMARYIGLCEMG